MTHVGTDVSMGGFSDFSKRPRCVCSPRIQTRIEIRGLGFLKQENRFELLEGGSCLVSRMRSSPTQSHGPIHTAGGCEEGLKRAKSG